MSRAWNWFLADLWRSEERWAAEHYPDDVIQW